MTVVGVAPDLRHGRASPLGPHVYMPYAQVAARPPSQLAVRAAAVDETRAIETVRRIVSDIDAAQPIAGATTAETLLWNATAWRRLA